MGFNGVRFNVRLQVHLSCLHTFHTVLVRRINKVIKGRDNFPWANIPFLFDQESAGLVKVNRKSTIDPAFGYIRSIIL